MTLMVPQAILFDMDGTLTRPMLDFDAIKAEMGIGDRAILEAMDEMSPADRQRCEIILDRHEELAAEGSELNENCMLVLNDLRRRGLRIALITRNSGRSVETVLAKHGLSFECVIARETCTPKPDPAPLFMACQMLGVPPAGAWMIGDGRYDIEAGQAAGISTVWVSHGKPRRFTAEPTMEVSDLCELQALVRNVFEGAK
ncbi:MAG TPA: HAD family hydrolase [Tepidisphaeraceae bacterium]|jgi:HAD superfamily hydrolase (TIGR01509 family)|nr:HAD family hydrolase [Tepidisphaeraceae bacterium]